jgi:hypothetical protein
MIPVRGGFMRKAAVKEGMRSLLWAGSVIAVLILIQGTSMGATLQATPEHVDFGTVDEGDPVVAVSEIVNTGSTPVEITNVRTS